MIECLQKKADHNCVGLKIKFDVNFEKKKKKFHKSYETKKIERVGKEKLMRKGTHIDVYMCHPALRI
jgi:hypothetical protein